MAVTFALQSLMKWACDRLTGFWRVAVADIFLFFSFVGTVNVWRGVWNLLEVYFLPGKKKTKFFDNFSLVIQINFSLCFFRFFSSREQIHERFTVAWCFIYIFGYVELFKFGIGSRCLH